MHQPDTGSFTCLQLQHKCLSLFALHMPAYCTYTYLQERSSSTYMTCYTQHAVLSCHAQIKGVQQLDSTVDWSWSLLHAKFISLSLSWCARQHLWHMMPCNMIKKSIFLSDQTKNMFFYKYCMYSQHWQVFLKARNNALLWIILLEC